MARKLEVLRSHCADEGRDYAEIAKTVMFSGRLVDDIDAFLADAEQLAKLGFAEVQLTPDRHPVEFAEQVAERIAPRLATIG